MNTIQRRIPIIAVFGSSSPAYTLKLAQSIGYEIARRNCILLTGGKGSSGNAVKEKAIAGVEKASTESYFAPWIGVTKDSSKIVKTERSLVIHSGLSHKRNYIEARLCDAAIALEGGPGTLSEVIFCLSLQKPVVLVGGDWEEKIPSKDSEKAKTLKELVKIAFDRVGRNLSGNPTLDQLLTEERIYQNLVQSLLDYKYYPIPANSNEATEAKQIVECVSSLLDHIKQRGKSHLTGDFPPLEGYGEMKSEYDSFIQGIENRL